MSHKKEKYILRVLLPIIILLCGLLYSLNFGVDITEASSQNSVFDLTAFSFDERSVVKLNANLMEHVPGELLTPEGFAESDHIEYGSVAEAGNVVTSRLRILVPEDRVYAFSGLTGSYASRIYVNGVLLTEVGKPGISKEDMIADEAYITFTARPENGVIEIVQQSSNFVFREIFNHPPWRMGLEAPIARYMEGGNSIRMVIIGVYLLLFFSHFTLFLIHRSYSANLWLALLCLVWVVRTGVIGRKPFLTLFSGFSWDAALRIEYLSIPLAVALLVTAYHTLFPGVLQKIPRIAIYAASLIFTVLYLSADTLFMSYTAMYAQLFAAATGLYLLVRIIMKVRKPSAEQTVILFGLVVVLGSLVLDMLYYNTTSDMKPFLNGPTMEYALIAFSMLQIVAMFLGTMRDVSAARQREQYLSAENAALDRANKLKADLMHTVGHELRTPLAVMMGYAQLVSMEMKDQGATEQATADLDSIANEARRLAVIVDEMQEVSLSRTLNKENEVISMEAVIQQIVRLYAPILQRKHTSLNVEMQSDLPQAKGNADELTQVLFNLLSNAGAYTEEGEVRISANCTNDEIAVTVSDTGAGISPEMLPHVFERGVSGKEGGSGLGLSICKTIVENHDGRIDIQSTEGFGTKVTFFIPAKEGGAAHV